MSKLSSTLRDKRKASGMSVPGVLEKLSEFGINISDKTLYNWETGVRSPNADEFVSLCQIYGVKSFSEFKKETEKAPASEEAEASGPVSLEETDAILVEMGYIKPGEQLSAADLAFLEHIGGLMDAWFSSKHS